ncbi:hypothetical protein BV25DRAFT_1833037 [Artomyces pyxidatus]|uniref:Uncharacterized protein n=1 Tax=Artomyces pyxidatus TaxID=48021 RepID=A0ACB8SI91_9AGAM|nr:hypothetical protein BV25DRAFT_1833037 [Artomyces pyxidatus]
MGMRSTGLATTSPCVEILRRLATEINASLDAKQDNRHAETDLTDDIDEIMGASRTTAFIESNSDDTPARNVIVAGLTALTWGSTNPLTEVNETFATLQRRRRVPPLVGGSQLAAAMSVAPTPVSSANDASAAGKYPWHVHHVKLLCIKPTIQPMTPENHPRARRVTNWMQTPTAMKGTLRQSRTWTMMME